VNSTFDRPRQNKANSTSADCGFRIGGGPAAGRPACSPLPPARAGRLCETNPIPGGAGRDKARGTWDEGRSCETKPIPAVPRATGIPSAPLSGQALPVVRNHGQDAHATWANYAKQSQFPPVPGGTGPEGRGTRGNRAKQSQFLDCGLRIGTDPRGTPALRPREPVVQTNPICHAERSGAWGSPSPLDPPASPLYLADCAKQSQSWRKCPVSHGGPGRGGSCGGPLGGL
jgi:hypothetical protein